MKRVIVLATATAFVAFVSLASGSPAAQFATCGSARAAVLEPKQFHFPRDDGAHDGYAVEVWRTFGLVTDDAGNRFDVSVNVSRYAIDADAPAIGANASRWFARYFVTTSYEVLDERTLAVERGTFVEREGSLGATIGNDGLALRAKALTYAAHLGKNGERFALSLRDANDTTAVTLEQAPGDRAVALGPGGVMRTGSCASNAAYAYAYPRSATHGTIRLAGIDHRVSGSTWIEHEFARSELAASDVGWNRYELQFDDGRDVDVRFTRDARGDVVATSGVFVAATGNVTYLGPGDAGASRPPAANAGSAGWHSDATGATYPSIWYVRIAPAHLGLAAVELTHDQEVRSSWRTPYCWGALVVEKADPPGGDRGHGFVELTGYAGRRAL